MYSTAYTRYVTTLLTVVYVFNHVDRTVFSILMEPIRQAFQLTDTELGFATGPALVLLYAILGIPVARWSDRNHRVNIMSVAIALWSGIAALTATADNFWQLTLARIGVGIGEAGFAAVALSVLGDYHAEEKQRTRAIAYFYLAIPVASIISSLMGGWINQLYGWRVAFLVAGLPGVLLALLMKLTVREPPRRASAAIPVRQSEHPPLRSVFATLWRKRSLRHLAVAAGVANLMVTGMGWASVFFIRNHHMSTGELGNWAAIAAVGTAIGIALSGHLVSRYGSRDERLKTWIMAAAVMLAPIIASVMLWSPSKYVALLACVFFNMTALFFLAPTSAVVQELTGAGTRATMLSLFIMIQVLAGGVIGIQLVGILSDALTPILGSNADALRWSMTFISLLSLPAALHFWLAGRSIRQDAMDAAADAIPSKATA